MNRRLRTLFIALLLGGVASAVGVVLYLLPTSYQTIPLARTLTDLQLHVAPLSHPQWLALQPPAYDNVNSDQLVIIDINDDSYKSPKWGPFPFKRSTYGILLQRLKAAGAKAAAFDIVFLDPAADPDQDAKFAQGLKAMPTVLGYTINETSGGQIGIQYPAPDLNAAAARVGYTTLDAPGGYLVTMPMHIKTDSSAGETQAQTNNADLYALPAAAYMLFSGQPLPHDIPTLDGAMVLMPPAFSEQQDIDTGRKSLNASFTQVIDFDSAMDESIPDLSQLVKGKLVYIGSTAEAGQDFGTTVRGRTPGLLINARFADQLMRSIYITPAPVWFNVLLMIVLPMLVALSFSMRRTGVAIAASFAGTLVYAYLNVALFITKLYWFDLAHVVLSLLLATLFVGLYRVLHEGAQRKMVTDLFGTHVSPAVVKDILANDDPKSAMALTGKRVKATIFYSDIRGFTSMSETMTPEEIYGQLNEYFEEMCNIIFEYGGYVDKFIGDCVMAVFSAPYQTPDDARNAVISAVKQQQKILEMAERWKAEGKKQFTVGMGVNTGDVVMGNLGASSRMNYTVIGDNVNTAARLYNVAKGGEIIISEATYLECKDDVIVEELEPVSVKGKVQPIRIYNVIGLKSETTRLPSPPPEPEAAPA